MNKDRRTWSREVFTAFMFIGLGLGMILGEPGAGVEIRAPRGLPSAALIAMGLAFIGLGLNMFGLIPHQLLRILGGIAFIALGVLAIGAGARTLRKRK